MSEIKPWRDRAPKETTSFDYPRVCRETADAEIAELRARVAELESVEQVEPARPMSDEKISAGFIEPIQVQLLTAYEMWVTAVRWTEEQHGIKGATE